MSNTLSKALPLTVLMICASAVIGMQISASAVVAAPASAALPSLVDGVSGMTFVRIPPGRFVMGSPPVEAGRNPDETLHPVTITREFLLSRYEATQQQWQSVMGNSPSTFAGCGPQCPVESVTFGDVRRFLAVLNRKATAAGAAAAVRKYRLPSEAEWEYACRAGRTTPFSTGHTLNTTQANFNGNFPYPGSPRGEYRQRPLPVGSFAANAWGLADMHGNVWEWTSDWYGPIGNRFGQVDPAGPVSGEKRVIRGGSWYFDANSARCALRYTHAPEDKGFSLGFRVAADPALREPPPR